MAFKPNQLWLLPILALTLSTTTVKSQACEGSCYLPIIFIGTVRHYLNVSIQINLQRYRNTSISVDSYRMRIAHLQLAHEVDQKQGSTVLTRSIGVYRRPRRLRCCDDCRCQAARVSVCTEFSSDAFAEFGMSRVRSFLGHGAHIFIGEAKSLSCVLCRFISMSEQHVSTAAEHSGIPINCFAL